MTFELWHLFLLASASLLGLLFMLVLAEPGLPYDIGNRLPSPENHEFMGLIAALVDAPVAKATSIEVLTDAVEFYPQELASISHARRSLHLEDHIVHASPLSDRPVAPVSRSGSPRPTFYRTAACRPNCKGPFAAACVCRS